MKKFGNLVYNWNQFGNLENILKFRKKKLEIWKNFGNWSEFGNLEKIWKKFGNLEKIWKFEKKFGNLEKKIESRKTKLEICN